MLDASRTFTQTLNEVFYVILDVIGHYGITVETTRHLKAILTDEGSGHTITTKHGTFMIVRTKVWEESAQAHIHGFRILPVNGDENLLPIVLGVNVELATFDTQNPEALWAVPPFWSDEAQAK